jgi:ELWxxDGT repeat protein
VDRGTSAGGSSARIRRPRYLQRKTIPGVASRCFAGARLCGQPGSLQQLTNANGTLFFTAFDGTNGFELWKSDGTPAGTVLVEDIRPGADDSLPAGLTNGTLFFTADDGANKELFELPLETANARSDHVPGRRHGVLAGGRFVRLPT